MIPLEVAAAAIVALATISVSPEDTELAGIIAGETIPGNATADMWVACTLQSDIKRGYTVWGLRPGRWNGYKTPKPRHYEALRRARRHGGCDAVPNCTFLGSGDDHDRYWSGIEGVRYTISNDVHTMVCVEQSQVQIRDKPPVYNPQRSHYID